MDCKKFKRKCIIEINDNFVLWDVTDVLVLDDGNFRTSHPEHMIEIYNKEYMDDDTIVVEYYYKQPILSR